MAEKKDCKFTPLSNALGMQLVKDGKSLPQCDSVSPAEIKPGDKVFIYALKAEEK